MNQRYQFQSTNPITTARATKTLSMNFDRPKMPLFKNVDSKNAHLKMPSSALLNLQIPA
jgi:hypothetical protein